MPLTASGYFFPIVNRRQRTLPQGMPGANGQGPTPLPEYAPGHPGYRQPAGPVQLPTRPGMPGIEPIPLQMDTGFAPIPVDRPFGMTMPNGHSYATRSLLGGPNGTPTVAPGSGNVIYRDGEYSPTTRNRRADEAWVARDQMYGAADPAGPYSGTAGMNHFGPLQGQQQRPLQMPEEGTYYGGGTRMVRMPDGRMVGMGPRMVQDALGNISGAAVLDPQEQNAILAQAYQNSRPGSQAFDANRVGALNAQGRHLAYQDNGVRFTPEQLQANWERGQADRQARRDAMRMARNQNLMQAQEIRREAVLEGRYGQAAQRRFMLEDEARRQTQKQELAGNSLDQTDKAMVSRFTTVGPNGQVNRDYNGMSRGFYDRYRNDPAQAWRKMIDAGMTSADLQGAIASASSGFFDGGDPQFAAWLGMVNQIAEGGQQQKNASPGRPVQGPVPPPQVLVQPQEGMVSPGEFWGGVVGGIADWWRDITNPFEF